MTTRDIRLYGDPVLKSKTKLIEEIDGKTIKIIEDLKDTLRETDTGIGLAANQIGIDKRIFVYDLEGNDKFEVVINPEIVEADGEWTYEEGCLSVPGLHWPILRPKVVHLKGINEKGNEISIDADELLGRLVQHELDHLDGKLLIERLDSDQLKEAKSALREIATSMLSSETEIYRNIE